MKAVSIILLALLSVIFFSCHYSNQNYYKIKKGENYFSTGPLSYIDDLYKNGSPDLIDVAKNNPNQYGESIVNLVDLETDLNIFCDHIPAILNDVKTFDITGKGTKQLICTYKKMDSIYLRICDPFLDGKILVDQKIVTGKSKVEGQVWDGKCTIEKFADLNGDGIPEILLNVTSAYDRSPRGIYVFNFAAKKLLWKYETGPIVHNIYAKDLDGDGKQEIFFDTGAPGNGNKANGTDDYHSYLIILNNKGDLIFQKELGGLTGGTDILIDKTISASHPNLITVTWGETIHSFNNHSIISWDVSDLSNIRPLNINDQVIPRYIPKIELFNMFPHLFIPSIDTTVYILSNKFDIVKKIKTKHIYSEILGRYDLNDDGKYEYVWKGNNGLFITNEKFQEILSIPGGEKIFRTESRGNFKSKFYLLDDKGDLYDFTLENIAELNFIKRNKYYIAISFLLFLNIILFLLWTKNNNWKDSKSQLKLLDNDATSIAIFTIKGKLISFNKKFEEIINNDSALIERNSYKNIFQNYFVIVKDWIEKQLSIKLNETKKFKVKIQDIERTLQFSIKFINSGTGSIKYFALIVNDITPIVRSEQNVLWLSVAQKLAHEVKNPLTTVRLTLQRLKMEYDDDPVKYNELLDLLNGSIDDAERIRIVVNDFMRFSKIEDANIKKFNLKNSLSELQKRYQLTLPKDVEIKLEVENELPEINADESQILSALTNLLDNAVQAITPPGKIIIRPNYNEKIVGNGDPLKKYIEIEIEDNGCGIDESMIQKIYEPFYTTKEGGSGLGLIIAKKIIEDHKGKLEIFSKKGLGTKVSILLPIDQS